MLADSFIHEWIAEVLGVCAVETGRCLPTQLPICWSEKSTLVGSAPRESFELTPGFMELRCGFGADRCGNERIAGGESKLNVSVRALSAWRTHQDGVDSLAASQAKVSG